MRRLKNEVEKEQSNVWVQLKRRYDLVDNLVNVVNAYTAHERGTITSAIQLRSGPTPIYPTNDYSNDGGSALDTRGLLALVEGYPDLKASANFTALAKDLEQTESEIVIARERFNMVVKDYNDERSTFPNVVLLGWLFRAEKYFEYSPELATSIIVQM